ncbi:hypothetical protein GDO81_011720 [Engystomops pustulosus]|uniref:Uncharacterized protein n=1 Tax=Engystomops pustulosus TaxID=76066 RepID=A0AAV7BGT7_ENGPU|nr:hypothetical protein GDO81_011720 [Engystomops pustulosus]
MEGAYLKSGGGQMLISWGWCIIRGTVCMEVEGGMYNKWGSVYIQYTEIKLFICRWNVSAGSFPVTSDLCSKSFTLYYNTIK